MKLELKNIHYKYKKNSTNVLTNINLELENGIYGIIGPNGTGKTTLLHLLLGILPLTSGDIICNNNEVKFLSPEYYQCIGYLPQNPQFYDNYSAEEFLKYISILKNIEKDMIEITVSDILKFVNLETEKKKKIKTFSGGMKQRLGIAQALLNDPKILILDEPTVGLDPKERIRFKNLLSTLSRDRIIIFSTHIISDIENLADEIVLMKNGRILKKDSLSSILSELNKNIKMIIANQEDLASIYKNYEVISIIKSANQKYNCRIIDKSSNGKNVTPTIDDVYIYYYGDKND